MALLNALVCLLVLCVVYVEETHCNCELQLSKDFGKTPPVFVQDGAYLGANSKEGSIVLRRGTKLIVACPGDRNHLVLANETTDIQEMEAKCVSNSTFRMGSWEGLMKDVHCKIPPWISSEDTQECSGGGRLYKVGYIIQNTLLPLYEACFNHDEIRTVYVKHQVSPSNQVTQPGARPNFIEGGLFGKVRMASLYKNQHQRARLNTILGQGMDEKYITKKQFLTRGHLAPRADFSLQGQQRASFHYVNTAPQWMRSNAGDWAALEEAVRRKVHLLNTTVTLYTGTLGVLTLTDASGQDQEIYFTDDENGNQIVPVPLYFFKVVYDEARQKATVFVSINSSYYSEKQTDELTFCSDICDGNRNYNWLKWRADGARSFCCTYEDFVDNVKVLPALRVVGEFY